MSSVENNVSMIILSQNRTKAAKSVKGKNGFMTQFGGGIGGGIAGGIGGIFVGSKIQSFFEKNALWQSAEKYGTAGFLGTMLAGALLGDVVTRALNKYA